MKPYYCCFSLQQNSVVIQNEIQVNTAWFQPSFVLNFPCLLALVILNHE